MKLRPLSLLLTVSALLALSTGCAITSADRPLAGEFIGGQTPGQENASMVTVELYPFSGKAQRKKIPLNEMMSVQGALEKSGATRRFKKMTFEVIRIDPKTNHQIKMGGKYLEKRRHVSAADDYTLHANDRIVVKEDLSTNAIVGSLTNIFGG